METALPLAPGLVRGQMDGTQPGQTVRGSASSSVSGEQTPHRGSVCGLDAQRWRAVVPSESVSQELARGWGEGQESGAW